MNKGLRWKETIAGVEAPNLMVVETQLPAGRNQTFATPADIVACLKANPEAAGQVLLALESQYIAGELAALRHRAEQAERERDEARYWLDAHKEASEALVDPVTGEDFFMLIGKGEHGEDGWFYTFGGPLDSYTLCERSDDQDPHFVYFQRERYDHDRGCWIDGCEVVEPVLAPDECSVAPYCLEDVTEERDALKAKLAEAERSFAGYNAKLHAEALRENDVLRSRLTACEKVVEAVSDELAKALESANGLDQKRNGSCCVSFGRLFPEDTYPASEEEADAFVKSRMRLWFRTWVVAPMQRASDVLRSYDDSGGSGAATPEGGHAAPTGGPMPPPEPAGSSLEATRDLQAPATRAELEELRREVLETVADVCLRADDNAQAPWPWPLTRLGAELRRRVERLEGG